jgi:1-aminocyclopropane-1-carboxylate deaminase
LKELKIISPLQKIDDPEINSYGIDLYVKRDDLIHPEISGNKWRKLKHNLEEARAQGRKTLLSFGGAYSNHIYALAAAGKEFGFHTIGIIRGRDASEDNPTLSFAKSCGMELHFIDRGEYRNKNDREFLQKLKTGFHDPFIIPEGGANILGARGCSEIISEIDIPFDYICCPCGTGTTLAGLVSGLNGKSKALGFAVLKGGEFLNTDVKNLLTEDEKIYSNWSINTDYHFGGYARFDQVLLDFIADLEQKHQIRYEPIYTGKMMYGIYDLAAKGFFKKDESRFLSPALKGWAKETGEPIRIITLHTGGLQGLAGLEEK